MPSNNRDIFVGIELSVEQLRACMVDENLEIVGVETIDFDSECPEYQTQGGIFTSPGEAYTTPVEMWIKALDLLLEKMHRNHDLSRVRAISGSAQHALVWWKSTTIPSLSSLDPHLPFHHHFPSASFSLPHTPTALDTSSHAHALAIEALLGGPQSMAQLVGSSATPSLVAGQMLRVREGWIGEVWARTGRVQFASSLFTSLLTGKWVGMLESEACATGMWVHKPAGGDASHWSDQILDIIGGSREEGRRLRGWLGEVDCSGLKRIMPISRYLVERYGLEPDTLVVPFIPTQVASYLSLSPALTVGNDAILSFGPIDVMMAPATTWLPSKSYQLLPHPCYDSTSPFSNSCIAPYIALLPSRNADVPRALARDMYTKSWSAFDRLVEVVSPGGSIGLDDKLFSFYHLQGDVWPYSHTKGIFRFETGVKVQEFRDLRANPRCLVESQIFSFRVRWSALSSSGVLSPRHIHNNGQRHQNTNNPFTHSILPGPLPTRLLTTGAAANFPSITSILSDIFHAPIFVPSTQFDAAQVPNEAHRNAPPRGYVSRAVVGSGWLARWGFTAHPPRDKTESTPSSTGSSPVWGERRLHTPQQQPAQPIVNYEDEIKRLLSKRWVLSGATWGRTHVPVSSLRASFSGQVGGCVQSQVGGGAITQPSSSGVSSGSSTPAYRREREGSTLGNVVFKEEDEDELLSPISNATRVGIIGSGSVIRTSTTLDSLSSSTSLASTTASSTSTGSGSPASTFTTPDPSAMSLSSLLSLGTGPHTPRTPLTPNAQPQTPSSLIPGSTTPTPLTPIVALTTSDADGQLGLVKIGEPDQDAHLMYESIVPEFCRLEGLVIKGIV